MTNFNYLWQMVATVTMNSSMILALILFATLVTGNGNIGGNTDVLPKATRDINSFPACITDSDCTDVAGLGGEVADFKCFQSMCFPWANKDLQGGQVEHNSPLLLSIHKNKHLLNAKAISVKMIYKITQATCTKSSQCDSGQCFRYFTFYLFVCLFASLRQQDPTNYKDTKADQLINGKC